MGGGRGKKKQRKETKFLRPLSSLLRENGYVYYEARFGTSFEWFFFFVSVASFSTYNTDTTASNGPPSPNIRGRIFTNPPTNLARSKEAIGIIPVLAWNSMTHFERDEASRALRGPNYSGMSITGRRGTIHHVHSLDCIHRTVGMGWEERPPGGSGNRLSSIKQKKQTILSIWWL